jgi:hypothetical protein
LEEILASFSEREGIEKLFSRLTEAFSFVQVRGGPVRADDWQFS